MTHLKEGDKAPNFEGKDENGERIALEDFKGKKVILFFYPRDNTPTCTVEACNLRDNYEELLDKGFQVIGISADTERKHRNFIAKFKLPYHLIADVDKSIVEKYGVWGPKKFMGMEFDGIHRITFVISENGTIERVFNPVKSKQHSAQILATYS